MNSEMSDSHTPTKPARVGRDLVAGDDYYYIPNGFGGESYPTMEECVAARGSGWLVCDHRMIDKYRDLRSAYLEVCRENAEMKFELEAKQRPLSEQVLQLTIERDELNAKCVDMISAIKNSLHDQRCAMKEDLRSECDCHKSVLAKWGGDVTWRNVLFFSIEGLSYLILSLSLPPMLLSWAILRIGECLMHITGTEKSRGKYYRKWGKE